MAISALNHRKFSFSSGCKSQVRFLICCPTRLLLHLRAFNGQIFERALAAQIRPLTLEMDPMRRTLIAGNWKMNLSRAEATELAKGVAAAEAGGNTDVLVCPSNVYLDAVSSTVNGSSVAVGGHFLTNLAKTVGISLIRAVVLHTSFSCVFFVFFQSYDPDNRTQHLFDVEKSLFSHFKKERCIFNLWIFLRVCFTCTCR